MEHNTNMCADPETALARHHQRQAAHRRRQNSQRDDLFAAARVLIPEHGLAIALGRIAVFAGLSRHAAQGLFNATTDLATALVRLAFLALIETVAAPEAATAEHFVARLIVAIRADAPAHRIHQALACGAAAWQRETIAAAEHLLVLTIAECLTAVCPDLPAEAGLARRVLALARQAALAPDAPDAQAEAAVIAGMLAASLARPAAAAVDANAAPVPPAPPATAVRPTQRLAPGTGCPAYARPAPNPPRHAHDPPTCAA
jgi:hypothetical protein